MEIVTLLIGIVLLVAGRRLFWFFVGAAGFVYGLSLAPALIENASPFAIMLVAILCGVIGLALSLLLQKIAVALAGAIMGGTILLHLVHGRVTPIVLTDPLFIVGAILGAVLVLILFDWALIIWSSAAGAVFVAQALHLAGALGLLAFLVLAIVGIVIQAVSFRRTLATPPAAA